MSEKDSVRAPSPTQETVPLSLSEALALRIIYPKGDWHLGPISDLLWVADYLIRKSANDAAERLLPRIEAVREAGLDLEGLVP